MHLTRCMLVSSVPRPRMLIEGLASHQEELYLQGAAATCWGRGVT